MLSSRRSGTNDSDRLEALGNVSTRQDRVREKMWKVRGVVESRKNTLARHEKTAYVSGV